MDQVVAQLKMFDLPSPLTLEEIGANISASQYNHTFSTISVSTAFGVLVVTLGIAAIYYAKRRIRRRQLPQHPPPNSSIPVRYRNLSRLAQHLGWSDIDLRDQEETAEEMDPMRTRNSQPRVGETRHTQ